jgi:translation initiation factor 2B subunit (eIF-2B alpha/beta/delta family)
MGFRGDVDATLQERIERIASDERRGAGRLIRDALETVAAAVEDGEDALETAQTLVAARPAVPAIAGAVGRVVAPARHPEQVIEEARALLAATDRAPRAIAVLLENDLSGGVMTHSASATVREAVLHARPDRLVCTVSEPEGEGRDFAEQLRAEGLAVDLVADSDAAHAVETVGLVLLGADTVFRDGAVANKAGTEGLAEAAKKAGVRVVVAAEVIKLAPVEGRDPGIERLDLTPPDLIDAVATEEGLFPPHEIASLVDRTPFLQDGWALLRRKPS